MEQNALVTTDWLEKNIHNPEVVVLDGSMTFAGMSDRYTEFCSAHIPGAQFFNVLEVSDQESPYPYMLPTPEDFEAYVQDLGISPTTKVVVYDSYGLLSAARVWWMFRYFGHENVFVLNGGFPKWRLEDRAVSQDLTQRSAGSFKAVPQPAWVVAFEDVQSCSMAGTKLITDARGQAGYKVGHIPGSLSVPYELFLNPHTKEVKGADDLRAIFKEAHVDLSKPFISSCGGGITACILALAAYVAGAKQVSVYDGSWAEWSMRQDNE